MNRNYPSTPACKRDPDLLRRGRGLFWGGLALFALGTVLVALWVLGHDTLDEIQVLQAQLEAAQPWLLLWRLLVLGVLLGGYDVWVNALADRFKFPSWQRQQALNQRLQVALLLLLAELFFAWRVQGDEGAEATLRNNWMDILAMMTVIAVAGMPMFTVKLSDLSYVTPCGGNTVTGGSTGTLYDNAFAAINGKTAQVPLWWTMLLSIANGINGAAVALIPCSPDLRTFAYRIDNARISPIRNYAGNWSYLAATAGKKPVPNS